MRQHRNTSMKIIEKIQQKCNAFRANEGITIACLGDSVTQGCFELTVDPSGNVNTRFDQAHTYHAYLQQMLASLYPAVPFNVINAGLSGGNAPEGAARLDRDVLSHNPDLVIVCFALNDSCSGPDGLETYAAAIDDILGRLKAAGCEVILMTPNMMNTRIDPSITYPGYLEIARCTMKTQNEGYLDAYLARAKEIAAAHGVPVCDCYAKWKALAAAGVDTTALLSNLINHPTREMNKLFAVSLMETIFQ